MYGMKHILTGLLLGGLSIGASALVLEQAPKNLGDGSYSVGPAGAQIADNFQFASDVTLSDISWWGSYDPVVPASESFTVRIFADNGSGLPQVTSLYEANYSGNGDSSDGLVDAFFEPVFRYDLGVSWLLSGGQDYYLSVFNNDDTNDWYWLEGLTGDDTGWSRSVDVDSWGDDSPTINMSFKLTADPTANVPTPSTISLMLIFSLWMFRLAKKRS